MRDNLLPEPYRLAYFPYNHTSPISPPFVLTLPPEHAPEKNSLPFNLIRILSSSLEPSPPKYHASITPRYPYHPVPIFPRYRFAGCAYSPPTLYPTYSSIPLPIIFPSAQLPTSIRLPSTRPLRLRKARSRRTLPPYALRSSLGLSRR